MLVAAARHSRTRDVADLLDLPLEQRTLLLDEFAEPTKTAQPDATQQAPERPSRSPHRATSRKGAARVS